LVYLLDFYVLYAHGTPLLIKFRNDISEVEPSPLIEPPPLGESNNDMSLFQNSVSFEKGSGKTVLKASFSFKTNVDFPKIEVLENPHIILFFTSV